MPVLTYNFDTYVYICSLILALNLVYTIKFKLNKTIPSFMLSLNSLFLAIISNMSIFNDGIYIDEFNLSSSGFSFLLNILNNIFCITIILCYLSLKVPDKKTPKKSMT